MVSLPVRTGQARFLILLRRMLDLLVTQKAEANNCQYQAISSCLVDLHEQHMHAGDSECFKYDSVALTAPLDWTPRPPNTALAHPWAIP